MRSSPRPRYLLAVLAAVVLCALAAAEAKGVGPTRSTHIAGGSALSGARYEALVIISQPQGSGVSVSECAGAVVGQRWVITAAHCLTRAGEGGRAELREGLQTRVLVARADISALREARSEDAARALLDAADSLNALRGQAYGISPDYRPGISRFGDVALIRVNRQINGALGVPLARPDQAAALRPGRRAVVSGWGNTRLGVSSSTLNAAQLPLLSDADCGVASGSGSLFSFIPGGMICGGDSTPPAVGACSGDSGGPLVSRTRAGYRLLTGVVSFGDLSCGGEPTFFTRIDAFNTFLGDLMDNDPEAGISDPVVRDVEVDDIGPTGAVLSAEVDPNGAATALEVDYSPVISSVSRTAGTIAGAGRSAVSTDAGLPGLAPGTTYEYSTWASNVLGRRAGSTGRFRTLGQAREPRVLEARIRCATPVRSRRSGPGGRFELSRDQLVTNQRIGQAALNRVSAIEEWLEEGVTTVDICGASFGPNSLNGVTLRDALRTEPAEPEPRALAVRRLKPPQPARFRLDRRQLVINQRIYQAALRKARAVRRRVEGGLTGGDLRGAVIRRDQLAPGAVVTAVTLEPVPAPSQTVVRPPLDRRTNIRLDRRQLRINQRIAQAAIRETRRVINRLEIGLEGKNFRAGSITGANLQPSAIGS